MLLEQCSITDESIFERVIPKLIITEDAEAIEQRLFNYIKDDINNFVEFYCFADTFIRNSPLFKKMLKVHANLLKLKEEAYEKPYSRMCDLAEKHGQKWVEIEFLDIYKIYGKFIHSENRNL